METPHPSIQTSSDFLPLDTLYAFVVAAEQGNLSHAALQLSLSNASISQKIKSLEQALGVTVFRRSTRGVTLTTAGEELLPLARETVLANQRLLARGKALNSHIEDGQLRITCPSDFGERYLSTIVASFAEQYPGVAIDLVLDNQKHALGSSPYDITLRGYQRFTDQPLVEDNVKMRAIAQRPLALYASPNYLRRKGVPASPGALAEHDCIAYLPNNAQAPFVGQRFCAFSWTMRRERQWHDVPVSGKIVTNHRGAVMNLLLGGQGIGMLFMDMAEALEQSGALTHVLPDWRQPPVTLYLIPQTGGRTALCNRFIDYLQQALARIPALDVAGYGAD
ncbi:LysR family transcriptional regulator [Paludibacterium purpuratum]|uniref:DNA-binding transcriptional LysR family regulator n=1 Tax=Paludibacterium purpuratum TaxID=1144873 RepID=A0A4R7B0U9_9NEIS|nr:LysR family transcriptional regulator [Paludibacterium purpuratum]TDR76499.1 DNA-binding transcriptional LysR family regulator [Paludibacterium purpuratum]